MSEQALLRAVHAIARGELPPKGHAAERLAAPSVWVEALGHHLYRGDSLLHAAVRALLEGGADPKRPNGNGTSPLQLARLTTGKSGSGADTARAAAGVIARLLA